MPVRSITEHVFAVQIEDVKVFLIVQPEGLTLIDAGFPGTLAHVEGGVRELGHTLADVKDVLVTHCHPDHAGGLAGIARATGARVWMHPEDAALVRAGRAYRPFAVSPGQENQDFYDNVIKHSPDTIEPVADIAEVLPGEEIPVAGGITAVGMPGHTLGHLAFLWHGDGGVLFLGDAAKNVHDLVVSPIYEDLAQGIRSLGTLPEKEFAVACLAHGDAITCDAPEAFRKTWS